jgi:hypothetical protein
LEEGEGNDWDGKKDVNETDALLSDSDGDGLADGPDFGGRRGELVGFGASSTSSVRRNLGAGRSQSQSTDPTARDSDADGLWDGDEAFESAGIGFADRDGITMTRVIGTTTFSFRSDPSSFDTDADQLSDGQEIQGSLFLTATS